MNRVARSIATIGLIAIARAQAPPAVPPAFEMASIRPFQGLPLRSQSTITEYGLPGLLMAAYKIEPWQISGGPAWLETDRFDIVANAPGDDTPSAVANKHGPKMNPSTSADSTFTKGGRGRIEEMTFQKRTMEFLALQLSNSGGLGREVIDKTGLGRNL